MRTLTSWMMVALLAAGLGAAACKGSPAAEEKKPAEEGKEAGEGGEEEEEEELPDDVEITAKAIAEAGIKTAPVTKVSAGSSLVLNGSVSHDENRLVQVAANVRGRVSALRVDLGTAVRRGDALADIESAELTRAREELVKQAVELSVSERSVERARTLAASKAISAGELQQREGDYLSRRAAVDAAARALVLSGDDPASVERLRKRAAAGDAIEGGPARLVLRAPFAGRVTERKVTPGSLVEAMQPIVTVADLTSLWVFAQAYERDLGRLKVGQRTTIRADAFPDETFEGRIDHVGSTVDPATRTVRLRVKVPNRGEKLRPGMFVRVQVDVGAAASGEDEGVLTVPLAAVQTLEGRTTVFVQEEEGKFERRVVELGRRFEGSAEVLSGVKEGEVVVTEGSFVVKSQFLRASLADED